MLRESEHLVSGKKTQETSDYIVSSATATAKDIGNIIRDHWKIENGLHWSLDVVWGSDRNPGRFWSSGPPLWSRAKGPTACTNIVLSPCG